MMQTYIEAQYRAWMFVIRWLVLPAFIALVLALVWVIWVAYSAGTDSLLEVIGYYLERLWPDL